MVVGHHRPRDGHPRHAGPARLRPTVAAGRGDRRRERGVDGRRARWPSASWPRRPTSRCSPATRSAGRGCVLAGGDGRLGPHRRPTASASCGAPSPGRDRLGERPAGRRHEPQPRRPRSWRPPRCWPPAPSCSVSSPPSPTASSTPPPRPSIPAALARRPRGVARRQPRRSSCRPSHWRAARCSSSPAGRWHACSRRGGASPAAPTPTSLGLRGLNVVADRVTGVVQTRLAAVLRGP